jgi:flagellar basal body rod protein FlgG
MIVGQVNRLEAISENLANATQPGYKKLTADHKVFDLIFRDALAGPMNWQAGLQYEPIEVDFTPGPLRNTDRSLDFAIHGDAFFVLAKDGRDYYTRDGVFRLDPDNRLVNTAGIAVQGNSGDIVLPPRTNLATLTVDPDGTLRADNRPIDALKMAHFPDVRKLIREGPALYSAPSDMPAEPPPPDAQMLNKTLEMSNTTIFAEITDMISCMRAFEICQRMIRQQDEAEGRLITQTAM